MDVVQIICVAVEILRIAGLFGFFVFAIICGYAWSHQDEIKDEWWLTRSEKRKRRKAEKLARKQAEQERKRWEEIYAKYAD